jgi:tRNA G18 (ribose-2'-O)-methylase SpoU
MIAITNPDDPRIAKYRSLSDAELLRAHGLFIAEGRLVVRRLLTASSFVTRSILVTAAALESLSDLLENRPALPVFVADHAVLNDIAGFNIHRGCLAIGERPAPTSVEALMASVPRTVVVLEAVTNADNVGGLFRCAAALGAGAVVLGPRCCDPLYRKAIRTSMGASLHVPFGAAARWPETLDYLRASAYTVVAFTPAADAVALDDAGGRLRAEPRLALVFGSEGEGLTPMALERSDIRVRIPIATGVDSLNVIAAAAIALCALRQPTWQG